MHRMGEYDYLFTTEYRMSAYLCLQCTYVCSIAYAFQSKELLEAIFNF